MAIQSPEHYSTPSLGIRAGQPYVDINHGLVSGYQPCGFWGNQQSSYPTMAGHTINVAETSLVGYAKLGEVPWRKRCCNFHSLPWRF